MSAPTHSLCASPVAPAAVVHAPSPRHLEVGLGVVVVVELVEGGAGVAIRRRASVSSGTAREARAEARRAQQHEDDGEDDADGERRVERLRLFRGRLVVQVLALQHGLTPHDVQQPDLRVRQHCAARLCSIQVASTVF